MYHLRKNRAPERTAGEPAVVVETSSNSVKANVAIAVAFILFLGVVFVGGGEQLRDALAASWSLALQQLTLQKSANTVVLPSRASPVEAARGESTSTLAKAASERTSKRKLVTKVTYKDAPFEIYDDELPSECHATRHADYDGYAVQWGLGNKVHSAAECCRRCIDFKKDNPTATQPCNIWVWCGDPSGTCWTMDIHSHTTGDCWLKVQEQWDNNPNLTTSNLKINHMHNFSDAFRAEHKTAPLLVPWVAGVIPAKN